MATMFLDYKVDYEDLKNAIAASPQKIVSAIHKALLASAIYTQSCFRKNLSQNVFRGTLRQSVSIKWLNRVSVQIEPTEYYADFLELGTRPHYPPVHAIEDWARQKGINPYALQHSIGRKGTKAHPYLERTFDQVEPYAHKRLEEQLSKTVEEILQ